MIVFFGEGRLGNQLFQYAFMKSFAKKDEMILTCNFEEFKKIFISKDKIININNKYLKFIIRKYIVYFFIVLSKARIINSYKQDMMGSGQYLIDGSGVSYLKGLFPITFVYQGYFQSEKFINRDISELKIKKYYLEKARDCLRDINENYQKVFVHIRRGDYVNAEYLGIKGVDLPVSYYKNLIAYFDSKIKNPFFIFLSDDRNFVKYYFEDVKNKIISNNSMGVDFAIMTLCDHGILSNSSFSWWGSYLMEERGEIFAPKYWFGFKSKIEFPIDVIPSYAKEADVL